MGLQSIANAKQYSMQRFFNIEALVRNTPDILYETKNFFQGADIFHRFKCHWRQGIDDGCG